MSDNIELVENCSFNGFKPASANAGKAQHMGKCRRVIDQCGKSGGSLNEVGRYIGGKGETLLLAILNERIKLTDHVVPMSL